MNGSTAVVTDGRCVAEHRYRTAGVFVPTVTVTDDDQASTGRTLRRVVSYHPHRRASTTR